MLLSLLPARCKKYTSSKMLSLPSHLENCLTRLSALVPSGTWGAMLGSCVLLLATMPLMRAARVCRCLARLPWGWIGYHCASASRTARYRRRLSLIVCLSSLLVAGEYTMGQPLQAMMTTALDQKMSSSGYYNLDLKKCPVVKAGVTLSIDN